MEVLTEYVAVVLVDEGCSFITEDSVIVAKM